MVCNANGFPGAGLTPALLSSVYSRGQFDLGIGAWQPTEGFPFLKDVYTSSGGSEHFTWPVGNFANDVKSGGTFMWRFKADFVSAVSLEIQMAPIFFSKVNGVVPDFDHVEWSLGAVNMIMGDTINIAPNTETALISEVNATDAFKMNGGSVANKQAVPLTTVMGSAISTTDWNFLTMNIEREADAAGRILDTFEDDIFLLGVAVQWKTNFENIAQWPLI